MTVNGTAVELDKDGSFTLSPAIGEQKVVATDKAGNVTTVTVTVNDGHTLKDGWSHSATEHWRECSICGEKVDTDKHSGGKATCISAATCETCGEKYGETDETNHEHTETLAAKDATCTGDGLTEGSKCSDCGEVLTAQQTVPATGHTGGTATCSKKPICETCGEKYGKLDPKNHEALERVGAKEATTTSEGNVEYWRCTGCGKLFSDEAGTKEIKQADTVIPKKSDGKQDTGNGSNNASRNGTTTKTTVTTTATAGKTDAALAKTGDSTATAAAIALASGITALGAALLLKERSA